MAAPGEKARQSAMAVSRDMQAGGPTGAWWPSSGLRSRSPWTRRCSATSLASAWAGAWWPWIRADEVVGFLIGRRYPDMWHVMDLAVAPVAGAKGWREALGAGVRGGGGRGRQAGAARGAARTTRRPCALYEAEGFVTSACASATTPTPARTRWSWCAKSGGTGDAPPAGRRRLGPLLAIESSCDDTAAAVLTPAGQVLSSVIHSQDAIHERYGGVVPEVASRAHVERMTRGGARGAARGRVRHATTWAAWPSPSARA